MPSEPITFFNRYTGQLEQEAVYGEAPLRFAYENPAGRVFLELLVKRSLFSRWYGWRMNKPASRDRIAPFIQKYGLDPAEFADSATSYASFNEFFCRRLKPSARPIDAGPATVVFPADGRHLGFQNIASAPGVFVKGQHFDIPALLGDAALGARYREGTLVLSRLCPVDYHRFHFPCAGTPGVPRLINGPLYSVSPIALRRRLSYLWENKRVITELATPALGTVLIIEVGATNARSDLNHLDVLGESLRATRIDNGLLVLRGCPLGVSGHGSSSFVSSVVMKSLLRFASALVLGPRATRPRSSREHRQAAAAGPWSSR